MKKVIFIAVSVFMSASMYAQTIYDAAKFANRDLSGSARFVGMGGAMGALGGDISTMGTNPAGIGIYRGNDVMATISYSMKETESSFNNRSFTADKNRFAFDNIGLVFSSKVGNQTPLRFVNFGFSYQRTNSFYKNMTVAGVMNAGLSQLNQAAAMTEGLKKGQLEGAAAFDDDEVGWLSALAYQGYLIDPISDTEYAPIGFDYADMFFESTERGGIDKYDFNLSFNFNERFYLGVTFGAYDVDYRKNSYYDEGFGGETGYGIETWNYIDGTGFDIKLGMIVRPFEYSPLRIGLAVHTPVFYKLTLNTRSALASDLLDDNDQIVSESIDTYDALGGYYMPRDFKLNTPWKFNASLGYTVGRNLALGAEYEYEDYSSMKFKDSNGNKMPWENSTAKEMLKAVSTIRLGAEYKVVPEFAIRLGYNYSAAAFDKKAWKALPYESLNTDTDFANTKGISNYTLGFGYRGTSGFYTDLAYKYNNYKEDFYAFDSSALAATKVKNNNHQILLTLGYRF